MAKISTRDCSIGVEDSSATCQAISPDFSEVTINWTSESIEVTGFGSPVRERVPNVITDWNMSLTGFYNAAADRADTVLGGLGPGASTRIVVGLAGSESGCNMYSGCATLLSYNITATVMGAGTVTANFEARSGSLTKGTFT